MSERQGAASASFDARPLTEPVDPSAVRAFTQSLKRSGTTTSWIGAGATAIVGVAAISAVVVFFVLFAFLFITVLTSVSDAAGTFAVAGILPFLIFAGAAALIVTFAVRGWRGAQQRRYRLDRFAAANGMSYLPSVASPSLPGMIFSVGSSRAANDVVRGRHPRFVEFANYQYTTGSGKNRTTHRWGYVAIKLDVPLPHIVLDATSNNGLFGSSNLPASFDKDQRLGLEGDFDRHFSLYCPEGYEPDALYLFTPDIMARFIDNAAALDVEIVDDWLFLYGKRDFSTLDAATWAWLFGSVGALLDKLAQWARWRDDRLTRDAAASASRGADVNGLGAGSGTAGDAASTLPFSPPTALLRPPPGVARQGRRLTRRVPWIAFVVAGIFVVVWLIGQVDFFSNLFGR